MAHLLIIGGHGRVALLAAPKLVQDGHWVSSVIRDPDQAPEVAASGAEAVVADVELLDVDQLADLVRGVDVVIWSAGAGGGDPRRTLAVDRDAAIRSMDAARRAGVPQYVMVSFFGSRPDHGVPADNPFHTYAEAKWQADEHLRGSGLGWTILRPSRLTLTPSPGTIDPKPTESGPTSRDLVADVIRAVVSADPAAMRGFELDFTDGEVPIADVLAQR